MDELNEIEEKQQENKVRKDSIDTFIDRLKSQETNLTENNIKNKFTKTLNFYNYFDDICIVGDGFAVPLH